MERVCVEEGYDDGHVLRKALEFEVKDQRRRGRRKTSGEGEQVVWSPGCHESSVMESGSWRNCC